MTLHPPLSGRLTVLLAVPALLLAFTACAAAPAGVDKAATPSSGGSDRDAWSLEFAQCLRDNGVDAPDPSSSGQGAAIKMDDAYRAALQSCEKKVGTAPPLSAEEQESTQKRFQEAALKAAKCYRDNGIDVPDPTGGQLPAVPSDVPQDIEAKCGFGPNTMTVSP